jgi:hypothetical protein
MTYKLFIWKIKDKFVAVFPEIDSGDITVGEDKEEVKLQAKVKAINTLKALETLPIERSIQDLRPIIDTLPEDELISVSGIDLSES